MTESLSKRVGRIVSGSVNALVDAAENMNPDAIMAEAIREVDSAVGGIRRELGEVVAQIHMANRRIDEENQRHDALTEEVRLALDKGREDLAEVGVAKMLDIEAQLPVLEQTLAQARERQDELEGYLSALRSKKREMETEMEQLVQSREQASPPIGVGPSGPHSSQASRGSTVEHVVERAESAFDRVLSKQSGLPGQFRDGLDTETKLAELEELNRRKRIQDRLASLRQDASAD